MTIQQTHPRPSADRAAMQDVLRELTADKIQAMFAYMEACEPECFWAALDYAGWTKAAR